MEAEFEQAGYDTSHDTSEVDMMDQVLARASDTAFDCQTLLGEYTICNRSLGALIAPPYFHIRAKGEDDCLEA